MANHNQNGGRNVAVPDENQPSWRPQDESFSHDVRRRDDERDEHAWQDRRFADDDHRRRTQRYGEDRLRELRPSRRDDAVPASSFEERYRDHDDRSGRYWADRSELERHASHGYRGRDFEPERRSLSRGHEERMGYPTGSYGRSDERVGYPAGSYSRHAPHHAMLHDTGEAHIHRGTGPHRGKGPAGYQRSDERIRELVCESLTDDDQIDASRIEVAVADGEVTLSGSVDDRHAKRDAEDCACSVVGVRDVQNLLRVQPDDGRGNRPGSSAVGTHKTETQAPDKKTRP